MKKIFYSICILFILGCLSCSSSLDEPCGTPLRGDDAQIAKDNIEDITLPTRYETIKEKVQYQNISENFSSTLLTIFYYSSKNVTIKECVTKMMESDVAIHKDIVIEYADDYNFKLNGLDSYYGILRYSTKGKGKSKISMTYVAIEKNDNIYAFVWFSIKDDIPIVDSEIPLILSSIKIK